MKYRTLGRTNLSVSEVGFGAWGIGNTSWIGADENTSLQALVAAADAGVTFFDTALVYGRGLSEKLLAQAFGKSQEIVIASKVPPLNGAWPAISGVPLGEVFPARHVFECLHKTLVNLQRDAIDLYQFHVWSDEWVDDPEWLKLMEQLRRSDQVRFIGISVNDHRPDSVIRALETGLVDSVQTIYNIFDQTPDDFLFPYCASHNIGVIARVPFDEGGLTGSIHPETRFPEGDFRNRYFSGDRKHQVWERIQRIAADAGIDPAQLPDLALRFCISHRAVSTVIAGMRSPHHVRKNADASDRGPLSTELLHQLRNHRWQRNFYPAPVARNSDARLRDPVARLRSFWRKAFPDSHAK